MLIFTPDKASCPPWITNVDAMRLINPSLAKTAGGFHIPIQGDSRHEGYKAYLGNGTYLTNRFDRYLQAALRQEIGTNKGGFGFIPCCRGDGDGDVGGSADGSTFGTNFMTLIGDWSGNNGSGQGVGGRSQTAPAGSNSILLRMNGAVADLRTSSFALVGARGSAQSPNGRIDVKVGSAPTPGGGTVLSTTQDWSGTASFGYHFPEVGLGTLDPNADNYILFTAQAATKGIQPDGILCMQNSSADVYCHNISQSGSSPAPSFDPTVTNRRVANYDNWTGGYGPCTRAGVAFVNWTTNSEHGEQVPGVSTGLASPNDVVKGTTLANYLTQLEAVYDAWGTLGVPVIHLLPFPRGGAQTAAFSENNYRTWVPAQRALAATKKHVCFVDTWQLLSMSSRSGWPSQRGFSATDSLHDTLAWQMVMAEIYNRLILWFHPHLRTVTIYPGIF